MRSEHFLDFYIRSVCGLGLAGATRCMRAAIWRWPRAVSSAWCALHGTCQLAGAMRCVGLARPCLVGGLGLAGAAGCAGLALSLAGATRCVGLAVWWGPWCCIGLTPTNPEFHGKVGLECANVSQREAWLGGGRALRGTRPGLGGGHALRGTRPPAFGGGHCAAWDQVGLECATVSQPPEHTQLVRGTRPPVFGGGLGLGGARALRGARPVLGGGHAA